MTISKNYGTALKILNVYLVVFAINGIIIKYRLKNTLKKLKG